MKCLFKCFGFCFSMSIDKDNETKIVEQQNKSEDNNKIEIQVNDKKVELGPLPVQMKEQSVNTIQVVEKGFDPEIIDKSVTPRISTPSSEPLSDEESMPSDITSIQIPKKIHFSDCEEYEYV